MEANEAPIGEQLISPDAGPTIDSENISTLETHHEDGSITITVESNESEAELRKPWITQIYFSHILSTWGDRSWEFLVPMAFAEIFPFTLLPVSLILFVAYVMGALFGSFMGTMVDRTSRSFLVKFTLIMQNVMIVISAVLLCALWWLYYEPEIEFCGATTNNENCIQLWQDRPFLIIFGILAITNSLSMLFSMASSIAVERDWIVALSAKNSYLLTQTNSVMQRIDLVCKVAAPAVLGFILQVTPLIYVLVGICIWNVVTLFPELLILMKIYHNNIEILRKENSDTIFVPIDPDATEEDQEQEEELNLNNESYANKIGSILKDTLHGWVVYFTHSVLLASLAFVLLFCTILAPGGLFNAYLNIEGIEDWMLGMMTGIAAIIGLIATYVQPILSIRFGPKATGIIMLWMQVGLLLLAVICLFQGYLFFFMAFVAVSRFPLWAFDLVERQIMQLGIGEKERGIVNSVESSMTNIATLFIYVLATVFADPSEFIYLALVSLCSIICAALFFSIWCAINKPTTSESSLAEIELQNLSKDGKGH